MIGGLIVLLLVAAFVAPLVIDWTAFRATFESRASAIIGQPVRIVGDIEVRLLPATTVTLEDVEIGDTEGDPMARVDRIDMRVELLPILGGQYNVTELTLDRPRVNATVDDTGTLDWLMRPTGEAPIDPDKVALENVVVHDGAVRFLDGRTGASFELTQINTDLFEAGALTGPWRMQGSLVCRSDQVCGEAMPVTFTLASGQLTADGSMLLSAEVTPASANLSGVLQADGTIRPEGNLLAYDGSFSFARLSPTAGAPGEGLGQAWTIRGDFDLTTERLALSDASWESADGLHALTGTAELLLGDATAFSADLVSRQIDLGRSLGRAGGEIAVTEAVTELWTRIASVAPPDLAGDIRVSIPSVIVSDSILQDVSAEVSTDGAAWTVDALRLPLPGQSLLEASGTIEQGEVPRFDGTLTLSSQQPPVLAGWWFGEDHSDLALDAFRITASVSMAPDEITAADAELTIGDAVLTGGWRWSDAAGEGDAGAVDIVAATDDFDLEQILAAVELLGVASVADLSTDYSLRLDAGALRFGGLVARAVVLDASLTSDALTIGELSIGDLDGARIAIDGNWGGIRTGVPRGTINASIAAERLDGVAALAAELDIDGGLTAWLGRAAPALVPLDIEAVVQASVATGYTYSLAVDGSAGGSDIRLDIDSNGTPEDWSAEEARIALSLDAADAAALARQAGLVVEEIGEVGAASIDFSAMGVPAEGMTTTLQANAAGAAVAADGSLTWRHGEAPSFDGSAEITGDLDRLARIAGIALPGSGEPISAVVSTGVRLDDTEFALAMQPSSIAERAVEGDLVLAFAQDRPRLTGTLAVEAVDIDWLATLPFGASPLPGEDLEAPWSSTPFGGRAAEGIDVDLDVAAERLAIAEDLTISNADLSVTLAGDGGALSLRSGSLSTGIASGEIVVEFEAGQALLSGQVFLADVPIDALVWRSDGQPVAEGVLSLSAEFDALGRSPAALASSLSGSGTLGIRQGVFHFLGADAFDLVIRLADEGEPMNEAELREAFTSFLDAGALAFGDADIQFDIAAGIVTPQPVIKEVGAIRVVVRAPLDLSQMTLDSSWELALVDARAVDDGPQPRAFVTFSGPITDPERQVNIAPLAGYLSLRRLRETDQLEAEVLERERFIRIIERIQADQEAGFVGEPEPAADEGNLPPDALDLP